MVDDDRAVREALRRALALGGYEVQLAEDGEQALERIVQSVPDAVVLDVGLPGIDGLEVCRRVRRMGKPRADPDAHRARCGGRPHRRTGCGRR